MTEIPYKRFLNRPLIYSETAECDHLLKRPFFRGTKFIPIDSMRLDVNFTSIQIPFLVELPWATNLFEEKERNSNLFWTFEEGLIRKINFINFNTTNQNSSWNDSTVIEYCTHSKSSKIDCRTSQTCALDKQRRHSTIIGWIEISALAVLQNTCDNVLRPFSQCRSVSAAF